MQGGNIVIGEPLQNIWKQMDSLLSAGLLPSCLHVLGLGQKKKLETQCGSPRQVVGTWPREPLAATSAGSCSQEWELDLDPGTQGMLMYQLLQQMWPREAILCMYVFFFIDFFHFLIFHFIWKRRSFICWLTSKWLAAVGVRDWAWRKQGVGNPVLISFWAWQGPKYLSWHLAASQGC